MPIYWQESCLRLGNFAQVAFHFGQHTQELRYTWFELVSLNKLRLKVPKLCEPWRGDVHWRFSKECQIWALMLVLYTPGFSSTDCNRPLQRRPRGAQKQTWRRLWATCVAFSSAPCASCEKANPSGQVLRLSLDVQRQIKPRWSSTQKILPSLVSLFHPHFIYFSYSFRSEVLVSTIALFVYIKMIYALVARSAGRGRIV